MVPFFTKIIQDRFQSFRDGPGSNILSSELSWVVSVVLELCLGLSQAYVKSLCASFKLDYEPLSSLEF